MVGMSSRKLAVSRTLNQGASCHALKARANDLYETPQEATLALLRCPEPLPALIWEPAAGRGAISRVLRKAGHRVVTSDLVAHAGADPGIESRIDFLLEWRAPEGCTCIVTNPPFKLADEFIRHGLTLVEKVIVLLRLMASEGADRSDLIDRHLVRQWVGIERLPMLHRDGWAGPKIKSSGTPFAWFVFAAEGRPPGTAWATQRISWREPPITSKGRRA
jgi:hypothetical protein